MVRISFHTRLLSGSCSSRQKPAKMEDCLKVIPSFGGLFNILGFLDLVERMVAQFRLSMDEAMRLYAGWPVSLLVFLYVLDGFSIHVYLESMDLER